MGVKGLTSFLEEVQATVFQTIKLSNQCFVIDGFSLAWFLYLQENLDIRCGGDYSEYRKVIVKFFDNLETCSILPIIVFDGAFDIDKRTTQILRLQNYAFQVPKIMSRTSQFPILPILAAQVFQQTLEDLRIAFVYSLQDADRDVAAIANTLNAFAVSNDSDFFILPLTEGYISLSFLEWRKVLCHQEQPYIRGQLYKSSYLAARNQLPSSLLFYLPIFLGCDWMRSVSLSSFSSLKDGLRNGKGRRIRAVLKWLRNCKSGDIVSKEINQNLPPKKIDQVKWCLDYYQNLPDTGECQSVLKEQLKKSILNFSSLKEINQECIDKLLSRNIADKLEQKTRFGEYPTSMFSVARGNLTVLLPVVVGGAGHRHSPHHWSYVMRSATYRLLHSKAVTEYSQLGKNYQPVKSFHRVSGCSCLEMSRVFASLSRFAEQRNEADRQLLRVYFMETVLGCRVACDVTCDRFVNSFPADCSGEIVYAATFFWVLHAEPPAFIASAVLLTLSDTESRFSDEIFSSFNKQYKSTEATTSYIARLSEWQSCVKHAMILNKTLYSPLRNLSIHFNCTFIVSLCSMLSERKNQLVLKKGSSLPEPVISMYRKLEFMLEYCRAQPDDLWGPTRRRRRR